MSYHTLQLQVHSFLAMLHLYRTVKLPAMLTGTYPSVDLCHHVITALYSMAYATYNSPLEFDSCATAGLQWTQDGALSVTREALHAQPASVQLYLMAQLGNNLAWQLRLLTCSCSASLLPIKVRQILTCTLTSSVVSPPVGLTLLETENVRPCEADHHSARQYTYLKPLYYTVL